MEPSNVAMRRGAVIGLALYAAPKALTYLCTAPETTANRVDRLREKMALVRDQFKDLVGGKAWFILTDVIADNAWISFVAFSYLTFGLPPIQNVGGAINAGTAYFSFCVVSWLSRFAVVKAFPSSRGYIGTRSDS